MPQEIAVRHVVGRYPYVPAAFRSVNIVVSVSEVARVYRIRLDDAEHPDAWMEITVEISGDEILMGIPFEEHDSALFEQGEIPF